MSENQIQDAALQEEFNRRGKLITEYRAGAMPLAELRELFGFTGEEGPAEIHDAVRNLRQRDAKLTAQLEVKLKAGVSDGGVCDAEAEVKLADILNPMPGEDLVGAAMRLLDQRDTAQKNASEYFSQWVNAAKVATSLRVAIAKAAILVGDTWKALRVTLPDGSSEPVTPSAEEKRLHALPYLQEVAAPRGPEPGEPRTEAEQITNLRLTRAHLELELKKSSERIAELKREVLDRERELREIETHRS